MRIYLKCILNVIYYFYFCAVVIRGRHLGEGLGVYGPPRIYDFRFSL